MDNSVLADTLAMINVVRLAHGQETLTDLPKALPGNAGDCLYARALRDVGVTRVGGAGEMTFASSRIAASVAEVWGTTAHGNQVQAPEQFARVISEFDGNRLQHYEDN